MPWSSRTSESCGQRGSSPLDVCDVFPFDAISSISVRGILPPVLTLEGRGGFAWDKETSVGPDQEGGPKRITEVSRKDAESFIDQIRDAIPTVR